MSDKSEPAVTARKSYQDRSVAVAIVLKCGGYGPSANITAKVDITVAQARELAGSLITLADQSDAKAAAKDAAEQRRRKWREQVVKAGRMIAFNGLS